MGGSGHCTCKDEVVRFSVLLKGKHFSFFFFCFADLPYVVNMPVQMYLPRGMMGRIECPVEANPPVTLILWSKNDRLIDVTQMTRMKLNKDGALVIKSVIAADEGKYSCTPYSPLGFGPASASVHALVRGKFLQMLKIILKASRLHFLLVYRYSTITNIFCYYDIENNLIHSF